MRPARYEDEYMAGVIVSGRVVTFEKPGDVTGRRAVRRLRAIEREP